MLSSLTQQWKQQYPGYAITEQWLHNITADYTSYHPEWMAVACFVTYSAYIKKVPFSTIQEWKWAYAYQQFQEHLRYRAHLMQHLHYLGDPLFSDHGGQWYQIRTRHAIDYESNISLHDIAMYYRESIIRGTYRMYVWRHPNQASVSVIVNAITGQLECVRGFLNHEPHPEPSFLVVHFLTKIHQEPYVVQLSDDHSINSADRLIMEADGGLYHDIYAQGDTIVLDTHGGHVRHLTIFGGTRLEIRNTIVEHITLSQMLPLLLVYNSHLHTIDGTLHGLSCSHSMWKGKPQPDLQPTWWLPNVMDDDERWVSYLPVIDDFYEHDMHPIRARQLLPQQQEAWIHVQDPLTHHVTTYLVPELYYRWKRSPIWQDMIQLMRYHGSGDTLPESAASSSYVQQWQYFLHHHPHYGSADVLRQDPRFTCLIQKRI